MQIKKNTRQYFIFVALLAMLTAFGPLSIDMYLPALPGIAADLGVEMSRIQLSLASFFIGLSVGQLFYGPIADRFGRKKPLYTGMVIYILASAGCALAQTDNMLIIARLLQALGGCAGAVVSRAMVRDIFDNKDVAQVFSLQLLITGVAPILAPMIGSYILGLAGWRMIFWLLTGLAVLCLAVMVMFLPETHEGDKDVRISRALHTYIDIARGRDFLGYSLVGALGSAGLFAYITGSSFVFIEMFGLSPQHYSWVFGSNAFGFIGMSQYNAWLMRRGHEPERILNGALHVLVVASVAILAAGIFMPMLATILPPLFVFMAMMGIILPNIAAGALQHERRRAGAASALMGMLQFAVSTVSASAVAFFHVQSAIPMTGIIAGSGLAAFGVYKGFGFAKNRIKPIIAPEPPYISD